MEHSTKTSRKAQKPAGKQRPAETPADWQKGQQADRDQQKRRQAGREASRQTETGRNTGRLAEKPADRQRPAETPADWQRGQQADKGQHKGQTCYMVHGTWYIADRDRQKRRQTGREASRQTEASTKARPATWYMVHGTQQTETGRNTGRLAERPTGRQRRTETPADWQRGQQADKEQQNHKLAKKTIHQSTSNTQKAKNIKPPIVPRETMANITIEQ